MKLVKTLFAPLLFVLLILDAKACVQFAGNGIRLCIGTIIPSLFPLLFLSIAMNSTLSGIRIPGFRFLARLCRIPGGSEGLLLLGFTGGYPAGAKALAEAQKDGALTLEDSRRMLAFCSNAGPAFIFGALSGLFTNRAAPWLLWLIQILSAILTAMILPGGASGPVRHIPCRPISYPEALRRTISAMAQICGWVILFQVFTGMCRRWFLWALPEKISAVLLGFTELTGGISALYAIESEAHRFLLAGVFLTFGGLCITMQTASAAGPLGIRSYLMGKCIQVPCSLLLSVLFGGLLYGGLPIWGCVPAAAALSAAVLAARSQKRCGNSAPCRV